MIIEMRTYNIKTARLKDFIKIYDEEIREVHTKILGNQIGFFYSEFGKLNQVIHLYGYDSYEDRSIRRKELSENLAFKSYALLDSVMKIDFKIRNILAWFSLDYSVSLTRYQEMIHNGIIVN